MRRFQIHSTCSYIESAHITENTVHVFLRLCLKSVPAACMYEHTEPSIKEIREQMNENGNQSFQEAFITTGIVTISWLQLQPHVQRLAMDFLIKLGVRTPSFKLTVLYCM